MTSTLVYHAGARGLNLEEVSSDTKATSTCRDCWTLTRRSGALREIRVKFKVKGDIDEATISRVAP